MIRSETGAMGSTASPPFSSILVQCEDQEQRCKVDVKRQIPKQGLWGEGAPVMASFLLDGGWELNTCDLGRVPRDGPRVSVKLRARA